MSEEKKDLNIRDIIEIVLVFYVLITATISLFTGYIQNDQWLWATIAALGFFEVESMASSLVNKR